MAVVKVFTHPWGRGLTAYGCGWRPDDRLGTLPGYLQKNRMVAETTATYGTKSPDGTRGTMCEYGIRVPSYCQV